MSAELRRVDGKPVLRFERVLRHPRHKVWRAVTDPAEFKHWFPAEVTVDGTTLRFTFPDSESAGEVLELDPPNVFAFRWNSDVLRFELRPHDEGCLLVFTHALDAEPAAGRTAAGWDTCLTALDASLDGRTAEPPTDWLGPMERYVRAFGLDRGRVEDGLVRFVRDLVWTPLGEVWELFTAGAPGLPAHATTPHVPPGPVIAVDPPRLLEFASPTGTVRWEFRHDPDSGTSVELTHAVTDPAFTPTALAGWHVRLELLFAATFGEHRPWPEDRFAELERRYGS
ncbi:SRPBCC family protein [Actinosynnema sp. NPDC047251]|uniref:Activator of Hsp90, ATPase 1 family protein n=1 Tax=Saccharothrix espanaensis (strain ATCC 51144 / DSM 44229 / JCM 9112 / NBRC 15066 / NRRL 15764) TaxID=1179773 RepID=K0KAN8_SACES|nr:SRPBCC family protein [Saccharothrix espanaensis]CCH33889.1 Activator of Hsp90, ATPase 1 family protein [Saccharothrix espanaensis DSM 44229]